MKKSYAVEMLEGFFSNYTPWDWDDIPALLDFLENVVGMAPPFNSDAYYKTWRDGGTGREWERENDCND